MSFRAGLSCSGVLGHAIARTRFARGWFGCRRRLDVALPQLPAIGINLSRPRLIFLGVRGRQALHHGD